MVAGTLGSLDKEGAVTTFDNTPCGWSQLLAVLVEAGIGRVGIEATGGYERGVARHLQAAGLTVVVLQPKQVKAFAQLHLRRAKTDRIDAFLIAACTHLLDAGDRLLPEPRFDPLADQLTYIEQIEEDIVRLKTRLEHVGEPRLRRVITADILRLTRRRAAELAGLQAALRQHPDLGCRLDLVQSIPGIGLRTALSIVVRLPELGRVSREAVAALAGLAPCAAERQMAGPGAYQRRAGPSAPGAVCGRLAGCLPLEPRTQGALWPAERARDRPYRRAGGLRAQAADLCQYRGQPWHALDHRPRRDMRFLGSITRAGSFVPTWHALAAVLWAVKDGRRPPRRGATRVLDRPEHGGTILPEMSAAKRS